jgi:hypothetical protein
LSYDLVWKAFALEQVNLPPEASIDELWATPAERRGLVPLAVAKWAQSQGDDVFKSVHGAFFEARHDPEQRKRIGDPEVAKEVLDSVGLDGGTIVKEVLDDRRWLDAARVDHEEGAELGVFGVPTLQFEDGQPMFVRVLQPVEGDRALEVFGKIAAAASDPLIHELKGPELRRRRR